MKRDGLSWPIAVDLRTEDGMSEQRFGAASLVSLVLHSFPLFLWKQWSGNVVDPLRDQATVMPCTLLTLSHDRIG